MRIILDGLDCASCAAKIEAELRKLSGLEELNVNFVTRSIDISKERYGEISAVIAKIEPQIRLIIENGAPQGKPKQISRSDWILGLSLIMYGLGITFHGRLANRWLENFIFLIPYILVGYPVVYKAAQKVFRREFFDENFLMTLATFGAIAINQLEEAAGVMLFYAVGMYLENRAVTRSRASINALLDLKPEYANLQLDGRIEVVKPETVSVGQTIVIKPGEKIPLDGEVIEGTSFVNTAALTGESVPQRVSVGKEVLAGMINGEGLLMVKVNRSYENSSLARIFHLIETAGERKAQVEQFITRFATYYTPVVVIIAALIAIIPPMVFKGTGWSEWLYRALVLLVISCPCALVVSIPLGYFGGIGGASRQGILVKGANFLDALAKIHTVVFDKTGTLTKGVFAVSEVVVNEGFSKEQLIEAAAIAEAFSNHPLAVPIRNLYSEELALDRITNYQEIPAHGVIVDYDGQKIIAGNRRLLEQEAIGCNEPVAVGTVVHVAVDRTYLGYIIIADQVRSEARDTIKALQQLGVKTIAMLTGDSQKVAAQTASQLEIAHYYSQLLPEDKVNRVEELLAKIPQPKKQKLAFVGDGINDAPVIVRSDIGIAMGGLGSDAAIEAADVVIMDDQLSKLVTGVKIAKQTDRIIKQNIIMALVIKAGFIFLGAFGVATIWEAIFADVGVTLLAVFNAMRTMRIK
ncbi:MAG TPA: heavy metal translocating P-type ATPase [Bacillota bacterium]|nr:heavy metal translocating P-type ATPase [Bacillota bacterium]HOL10110.1 heavy metal translocating P-type ATPase [Bacillota bacterium]HPO97894.1 heavy metal translocating P-type ATPase [Bacillota bacterium]